MWSLWYSVAMMQTPSWVYVVVIRTVAPVSLAWCVYSHEHTKSTKESRYKGFATNRHTNPPSTRVSLPTDTAEHAPNFLSPSTADPSEVTPLVNN